jgi:hypothetical protein
VKIVPTHGVLQQVDDRIGGFPGILKYGRQPSSSTFRMDKVTNAFDTHVEQGMGIGCAAGANVGFSYAVSQQDLYASRNGDSRARRLNLGRNLADGRLQFIQRWGDRVWASPQRTAGPSPRPARRTGNVKSWVHPIAGPPRLSA